MLHVGVVAPMIHLRLFGYPAIEGSGDPAGGAGAQRQQLALLARLALAPDRTVPRETLIACLWPETDTAHARNRLNVCLHGLRRALGEGVVLSRGDELVMPRDRVATDVDAFESSLESEALESAIPLYRGPLLDGFFLGDSPGFEQWVTGERTRLERRYRDTLEKLAVAADRRGEQILGQQWWRMLVHEDPFNTRAVIGLMLAMDRSGERGHALQVAHDHETLLRQELEAGPDPEFRALVQRLRETPGRRSAPGPSEPQRVRWPVRDLPPLSVRVRGRLLVTGVMIGVTAVALITFALHPRGQDLSPRGVVVARFENRTGAPELASIGYLVADRITRGVIGLGLAEMVGSDETLPPATRPVPDSGGGITYAKALAREAGARIAIGGSYYLENDTLVLHAMVADAGTGRVLRTPAVVRAPRHAILEAALRLEDRVTGAVATLLDERLAAWSDEASQPPNASAYRHYADGVEAFLTAQTMEGPRRVRKLKEAVAHFKDAASHDSAFTAPLIWAMRAYRDGADSAGAGEMLGSLQRQRASLAPWDRARADELLTRRN